MTKIPRNGNTPRFFCMLILTVTTTSSHKIPAVILNHSDYITYLHKGCFSLTPLHQHLLIVLYCRWLLAPARLDGVPLVFQALLLRFHATREFLVEFAPGFYRPPVRGNVRFAFGGILFGRTGRNPDEYAGGYRSAEAGIMPLGQLLAYLVYRNKPAFRHLLHDAVHL